MNIIKDDLIQLNISGLEFLELLNDIENSEFHKYYQNYLNKIIQTDTIIEFFKKK